MTFLTLRLVAIGLIATNSCINADTSLETLNNRLAELYKSKTVVEHKLFNCELEYKQNSSKKCHNLESQHYAIKDEIKRLEPKIREKELLLIISRSKGVNK